MQAIKEVTPEMAQEIRAHYVAQGVTAVDLAARDEAGLVPGKPRSTGTDWRIWRAGKGYAAACPACSHGMAFPACASRASKRAIRFRHCGRIEKLPFTFFQPWRAIIQLAAYPVKLFLNRFAPLPKPQPRVIEI